MWKCKECGKEVIAELEFNDTLNFTLNKNKELDEFDSFYELEQFIKGSGYIEDYWCPSCRTGSQDLEEIAVWED